MGAIKRGIRNAFRNTIRTFSIVVILGISIGLALAMLMARQAVQARIQSVKGSIGNTITISPAGARGFEGGGEPLTNDQMTKVAAIPHVVSLTKTLNDRLDSTTTNLQSAVDAGTLGQRQGQFGQRQGGGRPGGNGNGGTFTPPVQAIGSTNIDTLQSFGGGTTSLSSGEKFDGAVDAAVAIVGKDLATKNNLSVGSTFKAYGTDITVKGIFDSGNRFGNNLIVLPLPTLQRLSNQAGVITSAVAQVDSIDNLSATSTTISQTLGTNADVVNQQDTSNQALAPLENIKSISLYSLIGALVAGAAIILLTMLMIVRERRREIGVLKAIGASDTSVMVQFMSESLALTLMGMVLGVVIGTLSGNPITRILVQSSTSAAQTAGQGGRGGFGRLLSQSGAGLQNIQSSVGWHILIYGIGVALLIAVLGSVVPAFMIAKVRPAEVMRSE